MRIHSGILAPMNLPPDGTREEEEIGRVPLLSSEEEIDLAIRISENDPVAKQRLAEANLRLVGL